MLSIAVAGININTCMSVIGKPLVFEIGLKIAEDDLNIWISCYHFL